MINNSRVNYDLVKSGINVGRAALAQQFATMDGWQRSQDIRFDEYVKEKRMKQRFDGFDQRVERAYNVAAKAHKTEVINGFKRKLKDSSAKFTPQIMLEMKKKTEERLTWLREVWSQIDADYRSSDPTRQDQAAREISLALRGEPGEYVKWLYEHKLDERFAGEKEKGLNETLYGNSELPDISDEEVNRYRNLKVDMTEIERNVKSRFGIAGQQHWAMLQSAKDAIYEEKLDHAAKVYHELLDQSERFEESRRTALLRSHVERVHQAQVRFKAATELENERERLIEAHQEMEAERKRIQKETRRALLQEAAELRAKGATSEEVEMHMRERQLQKHAERQAEYQLKEQQTVFEAKSKYLRMIDELKSDFENRDGLELMAQAKRQDKASDRKVNVFGFMDDDAQDTAMEATHATNDGVINREANLRSSLAKFTRSEDGEGQQQIAAKLAAQSPSPYNKNKEELWKAIKADVYEDPFLTVHQARLDAAKNYDSIYARTVPMSMRQGRKYEKQTMGEHAAGNATDNQIYQKGPDLAYSMQWGINPQVVHDLDGEGSKSYFRDNLWHVRDEKTGDIDWKYEKKIGGPVLRGPTFYKLGTEREARDPSNLPMEPSVEMIRLQKQNMKRLNINLPGDSGSPNRDQEARNTSGQSKPQKKSGGIRVRKDWRSR